MTRYDLGVPIARLIHIIRSITLVNNTPKTEDVTVPASERWKLLSVKAVNPDDVNRSVYIYIFKEAAKTNLIRELNYAFATPGAHLQWPAGNNSAAFTCMYAPVILDPGNTISVIWTAGGASAGGTDADGLVVEYLKIIM